LDVITVYVINSNEDRTYFVFSEDDVKDPEHKKAVADARKTGSAQHYGDVVAVPETV